MKIVGGAGPANLTYRGSGNAELHAGQQASTLAGGSGSNSLYGGPGDDTIILGSGTNLVDGGAGHNTIVVEAPILQNATVSGGTAANNSLEVLGNPNTFAIGLTPTGGSIDVSITNSPGKPAVDLMMSNFGDVFVSAQDSSTNFTVGDLAAAGIQQLTLNIVASFSTARTIDFDTRYGNAASVVAVHAFDNS